MSQKLSKSKKEALRRKSLGELGELVAIKALVDRSFTKITNFNDRKRNYPFADLYAQKGGRRYVISVKSRNKYQANGKLNSRYKLGSKAYEYAKKEEHKFKAQAYWMAIVFDEMTYSIYMGSLEELDGNLGIPVGRCIKGGFGDCLVDDQRHYFDFEYFSNQKS